MKNISSKTIETAKIIILSLIIAVSGSYVFAGTWANPCGAPPTCNTDTPINVGTSFQNKAGPLTIGGGLIVGELNPTNGLIVQGGRAGIGTTNPEQTLHVSNFSYLQALFSTTNPSSAGGIGLRNFSGRLYELQSDPNNSFILYDRSAGAYRLNVSSSGNVGVGTTNPAAKLDVAGQVKITGGTPGDGKVLTSDASGLASWKKPSTVFINCNNGQTCNNPSSFDGATCFQTSEALVGGGGSCTLTTDGTTYQLRSVGTGTVCNMVCMKF